MPLASESIPMGPVLAMVVRFEKSSNGCKGSVAGGMLMYCSITCAK